jgi:hypothetical protein
MAKNSRSNSTVKGMPAGRVDPSNMATDPIGGIPGNLARRQLEQSGKMLQEQLLEDKSTGLKVP